MMTSTLILLASCRPAAHPSKFALVLLSALVTPAFAQTTATATSTARATVVDPGPRPVGNQSISVTGAILSTGIVDTLQPADANGDGAGNPLANLTTDQTVFWFDALAVFGETVSVNGATDSSTGNPRSWAWGRRSMATAASCATPSRRSAARARPAIPRSPWLP
jgi:hypothetical protein